MENEKQEKILNKESAIYTAGCILFEMVRKQKDLEERIAKLEELLKNNGKREDKTAKRSKVIHNFTNGIYVKFKGKTNFTKYNTEKIFLHVISKGNIEVITGYMSSYSKKSTQEYMNRKLYVFNMLCKKFNYPNEIEAIKKTLVDGTAVYSEVKNEVKK